MSNANTTSTPTVNANKPRRVRAPKQAAPVAPVAPTEPAADERLEAMRIAFMARARNVRNGEILALRSVPDDLLDTDGADDILATMGALFNAGAKALKASRPRK